MPFSEKVRGKRAMAGLTQPQLAERARRAPGSGGAGAAQSFDRDEARAALPLPFLRKILGLAAPHAGENEPGAHE